jgi:ribosomal 50S subunit-associated protein YjgA (DUF615 family)
MARKQAFPGEQHGRHDAQADHEGFDEGPSKSALKRQDQELRAIGVELVELPLAELEAMNLPESLYDAVMACRRRAPWAEILRQAMTAS